MSVKERLDREIRDIEEIPRGRFDDLDDVIAEFPLCPLFRYFKVIVNWAANVEK